MNDVFDLEERTAQFGEDIVLFCKNIDHSIVADVLIKQLTRSGTSIGANYCEANGASSKKDFRNKIHICKKEAQETKHWLRMIAKAEPHLNKDAKLLWKECQELTSIFGKALSSLKNS